MINVSGAYTLCSHQHHLTCRDYVPSVQDKAQLFGAEVLAGLCEQYREDNAHKFEE